jgi:maltooligosyltrehalose trehalohydrolase
LTRPALARSIASCCRTGSKAPDPAARFQPEDVHGPSEVIDPAAYRWTDRGWRGRPWHEAVLYELHVGAFTEEGAFRAAIGRLDRLAKLGVTAPAISMGPIHHQPSAEGLHRQEQG